jgi:hypothetical protein
MAHKVLQVSVLHASLHLLNALHVNQLRFHAAHVQLNLHLFAHLHLLKSAQTS